MTGRYLSRRRIFAFLAFLLLALASGCQDDAESADSPPDHNWSYEGETAPDHWGEIDETYERCATGTEQSPIDLSVELATAKPSDVAFDYGTSRLSIINNGHTVQAVYDSGSTISVEGTDYELLQFHFHAHSEHSVDGEHYPMEMHLVHQNGDGALAVVGVLIEEGAENEALDGVIANLPSEVAEEPEVVNGVTVDASELLPQDHSMFEYSGSLTTPPCTEGVRWFMMMNTITLSDSQIGEFTELYPANYRPTQPLNEREIHWSEDPETE